jgi:hypothetical protein
MSEREKQEFFVKEFEYTGIEVGWCWYLSDDEESTGVYQAIGIKSGRDGRLAWCADADSNSVPLQIFRCTRTGVVYVAFPMSPAENFGRTRQEALRLHIESLKTEVADRSRWIKACEDQLAALDNPAPPA